MEELFDTDSTSGLCYDSIGRIYALGTMRNDLYDPWTNAGHDPALKPRGISPSRGIAATSKLQKKPLPSFTSDETSIFGTKSTDGERPMFDFGVSVGGAKKRTPKPRAPRAQKALTWL